MIDFNELSQLLYPDVHETPEQLETRYPRRELAEGVKVTRFAPSPTGFVHFGGMYQVLIDERLAHQSNGIFYLRLEDTDAKREVPGAAEQLIQTLASYGIHFDEGVALDDQGKIIDHGVYGPYKQSQRASIYHVYAKKLVSEGKAYPVFSTKEELEAQMSVDKKTENKTKDWLADAELLKETVEKQRNFTIEEVKEHLKNQDSFVLRLWSDGNPEKKTPFVDLVKGKLEIPENDEDFVLLKSDGIPTYHFAHAVDDHLMGTTHVVRGEEWLPSLAKHIMLFRYLGFKMPKYLHTAQIMHLDENGNKKKLSKRDLGAKMEDYDKIGYAPEAVIEYILTLLNSNFEEWRSANPTASAMDFPFNIKKMSISGCLFDFDKLNDVSKNVLSRMSAESISEKIQTWAEKYDPDFYAVLHRDVEFTNKILTIGRGGKKPRKDFAVYSEVKDYMGFFYPEYFTIQDEFPDTFSHEDIRNVLKAYLSKFDISDDNNTWFGKIKETADEFGFASDMKAYKENPAAYKGSVADVSMFIRMALTGKLNSPDMYAVVQVLGRDVVIRRITDMINSLK